MAIQIDFEAYAERIFEIESAIAAKRALAETSGDPVLKATALRSLDNLEDTLRLLNRSRDLIAGRAPPEVCPA